MKIYTSYFGNSRALTKAGVLMIGISRFPPKFFEGPSIFELAPFGTMLKLPPVEYDKMFQQKILGSTTQRKMFELIKWYSDKMNKEEVALCCYEKNPLECHRSDVAKWFAKEGIEIEEFYAKKEEPKKPVFEQQSLF